MQRQLAAFSYRGLFQIRNLLFLDTYLQQVVSSHLHVVFSDLYVLGKLIFCTRKFEYVILVVWESIMKYDMAAAAVG
jgi:hypothetical protein